jgi:hypothetical protein
VPERLGITAATVLSPQCHGRLANRGRERVRAADHDWRANLLTGMLVVFAAGVLGYFGIV